MNSGFTLDRRAFGGLLAGLGAATLAGIAPAARAAAPDGSGAVTGMVAALQAARALSFTTQSSFGASVAADRLRTLGTRASVVFKREGGLFVAFGGGGEPDVRMLIAGDEVTLYSLSLAAKTVLKLAPENGWAFAIPGVFIPFLGLLGDDAGKDFFGGITSVTPIAQGEAGQPEQSTLVSVMGGGFTGEVWVDRSTGLPARTTGTWFAATGGMAASAAVDFSGWTAEDPADGAFTIEGLAGAKSVGLDGLGL